MVHFVNKVLMNGCEVGHNLDISNFSLPAHFEYFAFYSPIRKPIQMGSVLESTQKGASSDI